MLRLQKYLAQMGIASRRKCEEYIQKGKIFVNGKVVTEQGTKVNPNTDKIEYNLGEGRKTVEIKKGSSHIYILLNKPIGYVTTVKDEYNRPTVMELIEGINERIVPVGRLDMYTSGALILSNDGEFINKITHPKYEIEKTYVVTLKEEITKEEIEKLEKGVKIENYITNPAKVKKIEEINNKKTKLEITIHEGKNRIIRKMCESIGKTVIALERTKIGNINLDGLKRGNWRYLNEKEIENWRLM